MINAPTHLIYLLSGILLTKLSEMFWQILR